LVGNKYNNNDFIPARSDISLIDWHDPNPKPIVEKYDGIYVVRDDLLEGGSKVRYMDYLIRNIPQHEIVFGGSSAFGNSQVALPIIAGKYGKVATLFQAKRKVHLPNQVKAIKHGALLKPVVMGMLTVTLKRARDYVAEDTELRYNLPFDFDQEPSINESMKILCDEGIDIKPTEIWSVGASGTCNRALQFAFPDLPVHTVQVGHKLEEKDIGRAKLHISEYKFSKGVKDEDKPPFPSSPEYDAKAWKFCKEHAKEGALFWNVGV
jgi:hypothetical protein